MTKFLKIVSIIITILIFLCAYHACTIKNIGVTLRLIIAKILMFGVTDKV